MNNFYGVILSVAILMFSSGCSRDLSNSTYTSDATLSLTLEGEVVSIRKVTIKENDKLGNNAGGMLAGGAMGGALGYTMGSSAGATVGGALAGAALGAVAQHALSISENGAEYIIKIDTSKIKDGYFEGNAAMRNVMSTARTSGLITVVQEKDPAISEGQKVFIIYSDKRTRIIPSGNGKK